MIPIQGISAVYQWIQSLYQSVYSWFTGWSAEGLFWFLPLDIQAVILAFLGLSLVFAIVGAIKKVSFMLG